MCLVIDADCILANLLQKLDHVTVRDLNGVRAAIEQDAPGAYVDVTTSCLVWAVNQRHEMFAWDEDVIRRLTSWSQSYVERFFNPRIPESIRGTVLRTLDAFKPEAA